MTISLEPPSFDLAAQQILHLYLTDVPGERLRVPNRHQIEVAKVSTHIKQIAVKIIKRRAR